MLIPEEYKNNFKILPNDSELTILQKRFCLEQDRISRELIEKEKRQKIEEQHKEQLKEQERNKKNVESIIKSFYDMLK